MPDLTFVSTTLRIAAARRFQELVVYPLCSSPAPGPRLLDLEETLEGDLVEITETSEGGSVPFLRVFNRADCDLLILDGEELVGAKQNRVVNLTIIVAAGTQLVIPVSCVERGRWRWRSRRFRAGGSFLYPSLRRRKTRRVSESLRSRRSASSDQGEIWRDIGLKAARMGVRSETEAMRDLEAAWRLDDETLEAELAAEPDQVGYLAFVRGGLAGGDVLPGPRWLRRKLPQLMGSYYLDMLDPAVSFPPLAVERILGDVASARIEGVGTPGKGEEIRYQGHGVEGTATFLDGQAVHLSIFPRVEEEELPGGFCQDF